jgi:hypothetical protein
MTVESVPICIVCHAGGELHPDCPVCGAHVCWDDRCIDSHGIACLVATFKSLYGVDLPTSCHKCGRPATMDAVCDNSEIAQKLIEGAPAGGRGALVAQLCMMFCPAPACAAAARTWVEELKGHLRAVGAVGRRPS